MDALTYPYTLQDLLSLYEFEPCLSLYTGRSTITR